MRRRGRSPKARRPVPEAGAPTADVSAAGGALGPHTEGSPLLTGGDLDADWQGADAVGDEAVGGSVATPDQDQVDALGAALGVPQEPDAEVVASAEILADRDRHRWRTEREIALDEQEAEEVTAETTPAGSGAAPPPVAVAAIAPGFSGREAARRMVRDVMTRAPLTVDPDAPLATAAAIMREREIRHLPVVDDDGRTVGMISDRDLRSVAPVLGEYLSDAARQRLEDLGRTLENLRVRNAMTWDVRTIHPGAPIAQAAALMFEAEVSSLAVVEKGRLVGLVTERDVLHALGQTLPAVRGDDPDNYFW